MREGEGDDLAEIGGICQELLITRQRRVEADFGLDLAGRADALALDHGAVGKNEEGGRLFSGPWGCRGHSHPVSGVERGLEESSGSAMFVARYSRRPRSRLEIFLSI